MLSFSLQLSLIDATNPKVLSSFIKNKLPGLFNIPRMQASIVMVERTPGKINYLKDNLGRGGGEEDLDEDKVGEDEDGSDERKVVIYIYIYIYIWTACCCRGVEGFL